MKKQDLEQLKSIKQEIKALTDEITDLRTRVVTDSVEGSDPEFPYVKHTIKIVGMDVRGLEALGRKLNCKCCQLQQMLFDTELQIEQMEDSELRTIVRLYYRNGLTQEEIGRELGYSQQRIGQKLNGFFQSLKD